MIAVDHAPPDLVELGRSSDRVQPPVIDNQTIIRPQFVLVRPEPEIAQLLHTTAAVAGRQLAKRSDPVEVAVRVASNQQTLRVSRWIWSPASRHGPNGGMSRARLRTNLE